ncbi:hypothetical protein AB3M83_02905 [Microbacterium sp. 179-B 1A2 NHS]|uniref:hypothetical protein n=1 Tax=Microbacterium sp. 179-B 1A2 NHS TaxID=3142383 RepID=UPI0039A28307
MTGRTRLVGVVLASTLMLGALVAFGASVWLQRHDVAAPAARTADTGPAGMWAGGGRIAFRDTTAGSGYGHVASVDVAAPRGARTVGAEVCDRLDATVDALSCLRVVRGIVPSYTATTSRPDGSEIASWPLPGIPSRTRISPDGTLVATTAFVTGHSYAAVGFSTATVVSRLDGTHLGDLEDWTLIRDGRPVAPVDRNYWGVTFADDRTFYATVGMTLAGTTALVRGDIAARTLTMLAEDMECPSLSPDGSRIAFKRVTAGRAPTVHWTPGVYDIATGGVTLLPEARHIDDQIEWLDDETILYGMPREDTPGDSDVWSLAVDGAGEPEILIEHAWSPAVVRGGSGG